MPHPARRRGKGETRNIPGAMGALLIVALLSALFLFTRRDRLIAIFETEQPAATASADEPDTSAQ